MALEMSCVLAPSAESPEHARLAEELGYRRAWFYDSAALYPDVWVQLCRAAERTQRIGLGPGVLVPSLRHPMTTASAIATLVSLAGQDRVTVAVGSGFTGRFALGQRPMRWAAVAEYVRVVQGLLRGERVSWDGALIQMLHSPGFGPPRPIRVPFLIAAAGPKGVAIAEQVGDGVFGGLGPVPGFDWSAALTFGTVLQAGEDVGSERVLDAAGHAAAVYLHWAIEHGQLDLVPDGKRWASAYDDVPADVRHLALHEGHLVTLTDRDRPFVTREFLTGAGLALSPAGWRDKLAQLEAGGATEVAYQPAGADIPGELEAFATMTGAT